MKLNFSTKLIFSLIGLFFIFSPAVFAASGQIAIVTAQNKLVSLQAYDFDAEDGLVNKSEAAGQSASLPIINFVTAIALALFSLAFIFIFCKTIMDFMAESKNKKHGIKIYSHSAYSQGRVMIHKKEG